MARRRQHSASGRTLPVVLITLVVVAVAGVGAFALLRGGGEGPGGDDRVPEFSFEVTGVRGLAVTKNPGDEVTAPAAEEVRATLDRLYTTAFVDPSEWQEGTFPSLPSLFSGPAASRVAGDLDDLSLGSAAPQVERVQPRRGKLRLSFLVEGGQPLAAIAEATFGATGTLASGGRLRVVHEGRFLLRRIEGNWLIVGYDVDGSMKSTPGGGA